MKKQRLRYFIMLMTFALIGLIALQCYWVIVSVNSYRERFTQYVHEALNEVVKKVEQREVMYVAQQSIEPLSMDGVLSIFVDSLEIQDEPQPNVRHQHVNPAPYPKNLNDSTFFVNLFRRDTTRRGVFSFPYQKDLVSRRDGPSIVNDKFRQFQQVQIQNNAAFSSKKMIRISNKSDIVHFIVEELQSKEQPIEERINRNLLNSLLKRELGNRGIHISYTFWVEKKNPEQQKEFYFVSEPPSEQIQKKTQFQAALFPTDILAKKYLLRIYFPDQQTFILKNMGWVFLSSLLFIALIIFCMAYAVWTIIRQKKISEVTTDFINNMTHELKTPISTVALACEAIQDPDMRQHPKQVDRYLNIIKEENERLGSQVEKVLQIAVLDRGDFKLKLNPVNIHDVIDKALRNIVIQIENRQGKIQTQLTADNPVVEADELHINNMINNLLDNANKYSPDAPEITILTQNTEQGIKISISDKGQGMARETLNKVFDKFYRVSTGNIHDVKGFGLGLSYVKTMLDAHQGNVEVKSELDKGSTFTLFLPFSQHSEKH